MANDLISRQAAIDAIYRCTDIYVGNLPIMVDKEDAYKAIAQLPYAEPESERPLTEDDYAYCAECDHVEMCRWYPMYGCEFKSRPSVEPEIIRCKECKFWEHVKRTNRYWCKTDKGLYDLYTSPDDFCSRAERKE